MCEARDYDKRKADKKYSSRNFIQRLRFRDCPTGHTFVLGSCAPGGKVLDQFEMYNPYLGKYILLIHYILRMCINFNIIYTYFFLELKIIKYQI